MSASSRQSPAPNPGPAAKSGLCTSSSILLTDFGVGLWSADPTAFITNHFWFMMAGAHLFLWFGGDL
jgi:hypothetical protein